ncbi:MAG: asparagine synthase-related protein [Terriglobia bacterium]
MPGIVGLFTKMPREWAKAQLVRMVEALRHESFYTTGTWTDESLGVYAGWIAREKSFSDGMPLLNERRDVCLVFSGEEYPEPDTARRLKEHGHDVATEGPSYLVHLYEDDPSFVRTLNGQFHGLLADRTRGTATLFNDRYGMHRIYYHESKEAFYFAAEAKAILAVRPELRAADPRGLGELVSCGCVLENRTLFVGIHLLPAASAWVFRKGSCERRGNYFQPQEWEDQAPLESESYYRELRDSFSRNLPRYFNGKQQIGLALTGGLDTRVILAWRRPAPGSLPCYTWGGTYRDSEDVVIGRKVAGVCEQSYEVVTVGDEFLSNFPRYAERSIYLTDCCVDVSRSPDLFVSEKAREIAPVKVVGTYGSELLRHAVMFKAGIPRAGLFGPDFLSYTQQAKNTYAQLLRQNPLTFVAFCQSPWYHHGILGLEETQLNVRSPYLNNEFVKTVFREPRPVVANNDVRPRLIADGNPALGRIRSDRGIRGDSQGLWAMAIRGFLEFTFKSEYAYDYGMPQWVARIDHMFAPFHLERLFLGRHKFAHFRVWYRDALSEYVRQILLDPRTLSRAFLDRKGVEAMVRGHLKGNRNYTNGIHRVLTLELFHRLFLEARG